VGERGAFHVALAGGSTPRVLYGFSAMSATSVPATLTAIFAWPPKRCSPKFR
jgi:6-phosphogluconolactonase/glucosamine-6-phosphate isomerase/deaminase